MMHAIAMADGTVEIMQTVGEATVEQCLAKWYPERRAQVVGHTPVDRSAIPADRTFRNAWRLEGEKIEPDMVKARAIHLDRIRLARAPHFDRLDADWMKATGQRDTAAADTVETERQKLRDLPQSLAEAIEAATSPDELKAVWPAELAAGRR